MLTVCLPPPQIGPCIVAASALPDPDNVGLSTEVDGQEMQNGNTKDQLWLAAETIAELSAGTTLEAGSIISM
jgi:2-keto-4-pentenoate hydratase/2-oxohepta-3-ene-1,7-dioic acid hydratase in catechol pathway